jgi:DNA-binding HxlR family transcriptional regulator
MYELEEVREAVQLLRGRWELDVIVCLHSRPCGHAELTRVLGAEGKQLTRVLHRLRRHGVISRAVKTRTPPVRVRYSLTGDGERLVKALGALSTWRQGDAPNGAGSAKS